MKRILIVAILFFTLLLPHYSYATTVSGQSGIYKVTLTNVQVYDGTNWITIATPNQEMDIASGNVNDVIGTVVSSIDIVAGTYTGFANTVSATFSIKGFVDSGATRYYTTSSGTNSIASASWDWDDLPSDYAETSLTVPGLTSVTMEKTGVSITIRPGSSISFAFSFSTTSTITLDGSNNIVLAGAPGISFTATVDGTTYGSYTMTQQ